MAGMPTRAGSWDRTAAGSARIDAARSLRGTGSRAGTMVRPILGMARLALEETLWTTRCVLCDTPGSTLCDDCAMALPYIDRWRACPRCGSPYGFLVCTDCNSFTLQDMGRRSLPHDGCVNVIEHRGAARRIVTAFKDGGERRLSQDIARLTARTLPRSWTADGAALTYIPADRAALRRRGFDHMEMVAARLAREIGLPLVPTLAKLPASDQRGLSRRERFENMRARLSTTRPEVPPELIVVDDVHTTGATLFAACDALRAAGAHRIRCMTFARVV